MEPITSPQSQVDKPVDPHQSLNIQRQLSPVRSVPVRVPRARPIRFPRSAPDLCAPPHSTPIRHKASGYPVSDPPPDPDTPSPSSASKRRRLNSQVLPLLRAELHECTFKSLRFLEQFHLIASASDIGQVAAERILQQVTQLSLPGNTYDADRQCFTCMPPSYANTHFPEWFCTFANTVTMLDPNQLQNPCRRFWVTTKNDTLSCRRNDTLLRPDFILTSEEPVSRSFRWEYVLVVGEHESKGSPDHGLSQLASYAEQVFIAQPFRVAVLGLITSNSMPVVTFWRFDRAGAIGSQTLDYRSTRYHLNKLVRCLCSISQMPAYILGFHTSDITWDKSCDRPIDEGSKITLSIIDINTDSEDSDAGDIGGASTIALRRLLFTSPGLVVRGTRVWEGVLDSDRYEGLPVAVKFSWRHTLRPPETLVYGVAQSEGVIGIPTLIHASNYGNISNNIRPGPFVPPTDKESKLYEHHINTRDRILTCMVLTPTGTPISDPRLPPLAIARALLAGLIGHASLYFQAKILHRDISPNNILALRDPVRATLPKWMCSSTEPLPCLLHGCLIDLEYAVHGDAGVSGAADRTGTYPFIAIKVLQGMEPHRYRHDLESLFYVLLWVSCYPVPEPKAGAVANTLIDELWPAHDPLSFWITGDPHQVAHTKKSTIVFGVEEFNMLLERFRPGFEHFREAAVEFRRILWAVPGGLCNLVSERKSAPGDNMVNHQQETDYTQEPASEINEGNEGNEGGTREHGQEGEGKKEDEEERNEEEEDDEEDDDEEDGDEGGEGRAVSLGQNKVVKEGRNPPELTLGPDDVRVGVSSLEAFGEIKHVLEELIARLTPRRKQKRRKIRGLKEQSN